MSTVIDAFHLPGARELPVLEQPLGSGAAAVVLRYPELRASDVESLATALKASREALLLRRPVDSIVDAIDATALALRDQAHPLRRLLDRHLGAVTGYSQAMAGLVLERMLADWRRPALEALLRAELGDAGVLDGFRPDPAVEGRRIRGLGAPLAYHVFAGNVPGVAVTAMIRALLVKSAVLGKCGADDPLLPPLFARTLADIDPELGQCIAVTYWRGGTTELETAACAAADTVVVYGSSDAVAAARRAARADARVVVHGPRIAVGLIGREALTTARLDATGLAAARAAALFDQRGCVSPHLYYVEAGGEASPEAFARSLAAGLQTIELQLPSGELNTADTARIRALHAHAEFRELAGEPVRLLSAGPHAAVILDQDPSFAASCLHRTVWVKPLPSLDDAVALLRPQAHWLGAVGLACDDARVDALAERLARIGVARISSLNTLPWPPAHGHHDGASPLRELIRWVDLEPLGPDQPDRWTSARSAAASAGP